ncbi:nuclear transport factor 2 family protein [Paraferrimonas sp. SM1919]|uniref:nuclear transport factor 2 family protein n=1 Tax=Paraferrimonas sp. SM1919 TaxID=2662263 RepID=UPI0013CF9FD9|nr:nuclear transport factor 2 family protein [Paraferrimonas sp. SM1919]
MKLLTNKAIFLLMLLYSTLTQADTPEQILDQLHISAANAQWNSYFNLFDKDGIFLGTDATEHWTKQEFEVFSRKTQGWKYRVLDRTLNRFNDTITFDELLENDTYGLSRGTGTIIKTTKGWKIAQYHLSFPIPNKIAKNITEQIKQHRVKKDK